MKAHTRPARISSYSKIAIASVAAIGGTASGDAAVIYFDVDPDFNTGNDGDFTAGDINLANGTYTLGSSGGYWFSLYAISNGIYWGGNIFQAEGPIGFGTGAVPFAYGATIDDALTWGSSSISYVGGTSPWVNGANTYVALRLDQGDGIFHYGWVNLTFTVNEGALVTGFAFEGEANTAIEAGAIPEPSTYALLALAGLFGAAVWHHRRQKVGAPTELLQLAAGARGVEQLRSDRKS